MMDWRSNTCLRAVMQRLRDGPAMTHVLASAAGHASSALIRVSLRKLEDAGLIARSPRFEGPGEIQWCLTDAGLEALDA